MPKLNAANIIVELAGEIKVPLPDGWIINDSTSAEYPYQIINSEQSAELLIFKSTLSENDIITTKSELKASVDGVIEEVILDLEDAKLLTNTGYFEDNRVSFVLEFTSLDIASQSTIFHRLKGIIYQHPEGHQILFTLWAKTAESSKDILTKELAFMMEEMVYYGEAETEIFVSESSLLKYYGLLFVLLIAVVFLFIRTRTQIKSEKKSQNYHYWQCECGRQNHNDHKTCHRCGREAPL
jgi:hypothetical protein